MKYFIHLPVILIILLSGCKKFTAIPAPANQLRGIEVFTSDATALAATYGMYSKMMESSLNVAGGSQSITLLAGLAADELDCYSTDPDKLAFSLNSLNSKNELISAIWSELYRYIYNANAILENCAESTSLSPGVSSYIQGQALFVRAFCNYYLTALWGEIPIVVSTDYTTNQHLARKSLQEVYAFIINDLQSAEQLLPKDFSAGNGERIFPTKWAAAALLARCYLMTGEYDLAVQSATSIINTVLFKVQSDPDAVFLANSIESIWQLHPVVTGYNTFDGSAFILTRTPSDVALRTDLVHAFEEIDLRKLHWVNAKTSGASTYYFPFKYKFSTSPATSSGPTEYLTVFRLAEQYLIRAEARTEMGALEEARSDLDLIRHRAGLLPTTAVTHEDMIEAILKERRLELFTEWGHRWIDLGRLNKTDEWLIPIKFPNWSSEDKLFPLPLSDIKINNQLTQNKGY